MSKIKDKKFNKLFGIGYDQLGDVLVISPFFKPKLFFNRLENPKHFKGMLFYGLTGMFKNKRVSFICTGMGQSLVADCVLAQDPKIIKTIIFLGAVGAIRDLAIADNVIIEKAIFDTSYYKQFNIEINENSKKEFFPAAELVEKTLMLAKEKNFSIKKANTISIHTFINQSIEIGKELSQAGIQSVDLECALFYAAAELKQINAIAFCFVSDNILEQPFWEDFSLQEKAKMRNQMAELVNFSLELG